MNRICRSLALGVLCVCSMVSVAAAQELTIPRLAKAPTLDGALAPGEWDAAAQVTGLIAQFDGVPDPRPVTFWIGYDDQNVYVAQRSTVQPREWSPRTRPIWFKKGDSSFVIGLAPGRVNRGDEPSHYLLRVNLHGQTLTQEITWKIKGVRLTFPHPAWLVKPEIKQAFNADKTEWTSEVAIPLASMKVDAVKDGEDWGLLLARDYEQADQSANVVSSDWRFGDGDRHYGRAFYNNYRLEKEYGQARMGSVPAIKAPAPAKGAAAGHKGVSVPDFSFLGYQKGGGLLVSSAELRQYGVYTGAGERELTATSYDPITGDFYARLDISDLPEVRKAVRGEVVIRKAGEAKPVATHPIPHFPADAKQERVRFHLPDLKPGVYQATGNIYDERGTLLGQARQNFIRYDHAKDLPWLGNQLGVNDKVLPPWTPIASKSNAERKTLDLSCWGRTYHVAESGLFAGIDTQAQSGLAPSTRDILAGPVRVEVIQDGKAVPQPASGLKDVKTAAHEASYRGELTGKGWRVATRSRMEYDGYVEHRLTISPEGEQRADRLRLVIPLKPEEATHLHAVGGDWFRASVSSIALEGDGVLWHSGQKHGLGITVDKGPFGRMMMVGNFRPYVWIGGPHRGLAFMADNDQGWVPDDTKKVPAIEVVREGDHVNLVLNLVARPFTFTKPREVLFSLQATPIRPLTADFRNRLERLSLQTCFPGADPDGWCWNGSMFWIGGQHLVGGHGSMPYPLNWDRNIKKRKEWEDRGHILTPYQSQLNLMAFGEVDDPRMPPGRQSSDVYGYIYPHIAAGCLEHGNLNIAKPDLEYRLWCYQAWIKGAGIKGLYFDQTEPILGANPSAGCGYILDLPDRPDLHGRVQPGYLLTNTREFYKRLRTLFVENGVEDPMIWLHTTDANMISAFAFVGAFLEGENLPELTPENPWFSKKYAPERMQAVTNPGKWGIGSVWLDMIARSWNWPEARDRQYMAGRSVQGYARVHDFADRWNYLKWGPFDPAKPMTFLPYWDPKVAAALRTDAPNILASAYRQDNRLQVFVFNRSEKTLEGVHVKVDAAALGLQLPAGGTLQAEDLKGWEQKQELPMTWQAAGAVGTLTLTIPPHDYRIVLIKPVKDK